MFNYIHLIVIYLFFKKLVSFWFHDIDYRLGKMQQNPLLLPFLSWISAVGEEL